MADRASSLKIGIVGYGHLGEPFDRNFNQLAFTNSLLFSTYCSAKSYNTTQGMKLYVILTSSGQFLVQKIQKEGAGVGLQLAYVWNRNPEKLKDSVPKDLILNDLSDFTHRSALQFTLKLTYCMYICFDVNVCFYVFVVF